jgi:endonuclease YncB( thermonuclease family)
VIKVYDGDTLTVATALWAGSPWYRFSIRIRGIDCAEKTSSRASEKECAQLAQARVAALVLGQEVRLTPYQQDKYGRVLCDVHLDVPLDPSSDSLSIGNLLLSERLAVPYDGKTKHAPVDWMTFHRTGSMTAR